MDQSEEESIATLPKLIKDKIDDYKSIFQVNAVADEMFNKMKKQIRVLSHQVYEISGSHYVSRICYGYDVIEGKKKYCLNVDLLEDEDYIYFPSATNYLCISCQQTKN
jgi:hypothetical protein